LIEKSKELIYKKTNLGEDSFFHSNPKAGGRKIGTFFGQQ
jgi:hypothetical protein